MQSLEFAAHPRDWPSFWAIFAGAVRNGSERESLRARESGVGGQTGQSDDDDDDYTHSQYLLLSPLCVVLAAVSCHLLLHVLYHHHLQTRLL